MKLRLSPDLLSALLFLGLGFFILVHGSEYPMGSASRMGAGYFPRLVSFGLLLVGAILAVRALRGKTETIERIRIRPLIFVLAGTLSFGLLIQKGGLLLAGAALVILSRLGAEDFRPLEVLGLAAVLVVATAALFSYALGLTVPVLPRW